ncbi:MAG TPA: endonuclease/exonuclease/phosphatase family protein [Jatrophihabitans sp.]
MTWNVENFFTPKPADQAAYDAKVAALAAVVTDAQPDLVALQEVGDPDSFDALRAALGGGWTGELATHFEPSHAIRVGWVSTGMLTDVEEVIDLPAQLSPVKVDDNGTTITQLGRGALAVIYTTNSGVAVRALTCHLKSKLLSFPGGKFDTTDEAQRARYGVYALDRRAAEAAAVRDWATSNLAGGWADKPLLVCGDLNDTMEAATTQLLFGPPGSQIGTGRLHPPRPRRCATAVGRRLPDDSAEQLLSHQPRPRRTDRPRPRISRPDRHARRGRHHRRGRPQHRHPPGARTARRPTLRPPAGRRALRSLSGAAHTPTVNQAGGQHGIPVSAYKTAVARVEWRAIATRTRLAAAPPHMYSWYSRTRVCAG